ncbi:Ff.00g030240.m01.CDS01 [Fusarium sp. VM40]|nr:Ff.00g030240.m01.CDS01 [Fusarium sp. VM40]
MPSSLRSVFSRQKREKSSTSDQDSTESWSLERYRREYEDLALEMKMVRQLAHADRQACYNAQHDTISSRSMLLAVRKAFKDLENDLANGIDIDRCRRVVWESGVSTHATNEVHNELKKLRVTVNGLKSRAKQLAAEVKEHLK